MNLCTLTENELLDLDLTELTLLELCNYIGHLIVDNAVMFIQCKPLIPILIQGVLFRNDNVVMPELVKGTIKI